jgi:hypothetical protein
MDDYGALAPAEHSWLLVYPGMAVGVLFFRFSLVKGVAQTWIG